MLHFVRHHDGSAKGDGYFATQLSFFKYIHHAFKTQGHLAFLVAFLPWAAHATLDAPTNFRTDPADFSDLDLPVGAVAYQFRWTDNATSEMGYQVEVSRDGVNYQLEKTLLANAQGYDRAIVPWTSNRWYRIRAVNATEVSAYAGPILARGYMPPTRLGGSTSDPAHMALTWATAGGYIDGYTVQQDTTTNFSGANLRQYYVPGKSSTSYQINFNYAPGTIYYFRVVSTNSAVGNGTSDAMNKPAAYLACAPNGPPTPPIFVSQHMDNNPNEALILFDKDSLNETSWSLQYSTNAGGNWYSVPVVWTEGTRYTVTHSGLAPGVFYSYRLAAVNANGSSSYATWSFTPPANPPPGNTVWYVDGSAAGNSDGASWANAWTSLGAINWSALKPGHTVYVSGGVYTNCLVTFANGAYGNPIVIKTATNAPHNGRVVIYGQIAWKSSYVTIDGALDDSYAPAQAEDVPNNINLEVIARGDASSGVFPYVCVGAVGTWMEIHNAGNPLSGEGEGDGLTVTPGYLGPTNSVFAYLWIHDNYGSIITESRAAGFFGYAGVTFHHILGENCHNNFLMGEGSYDLHDCLLRDWKSPGVAHPDGIQGGISNVRMWNNRLQNSCSSGSMFYPDLSGDQANFAMVNNVFSGDQVNCQVSISSVPQTMTLSNMVIAGNTFYGLSTVNFNVVNNGTPNRFLKAWIVENNLFISGNNCSSAAGAFSTGGCMYNPSDVVFDHNIICGPGKLMFYRTNNSVLAGVNLFPNAEAFNSWSTSYKYNSSATPVVFNVANNDFRLLGADTAARHAGADLSALAAQVPGITADLLGTPRPRGAPWDIGAYQYNATYSVSNTSPGLVMQLNFENDFYSRTNKYAADASGNGRDGLRFGRSASMTNYPTPVLSYDGSVAAEFHFYPNDVQAGQPQYFTGDYIAVTNLNGIRSLTKMTAAAWVKYYEGVNNANATIFSSGHNELGNWRMGRDGYARTMFTISPDGVSLIPDNRFLAFPDDGITNQWHHYAVTWDGSTHTAIAYFDGLPCATNTTDAANVQALTFGPAYLGIGCWTFNEDPWIFPVASGGPDNHPNNGWLHGAMDDLRLYNRALAPFEIQAEFGGTGGPANYTLQVAASGGGQGTVASSPAGIICGTACAGTFTAGTVVTLTATPDGASLFTGWSGAASGANPSCTITLTNNATVTASFAPRDVVAPAVAILTPASASTAAGNVRLSATASDNYGVAEVQFMVDGGNVGPRLLSSPYAFTWQTTSVSNGIHTLTAVARDTAGNSTVSAPVDVTVANSDLVLHFDFETNFSGGVVRDVSNYGNHGIRYSLAHWPTNVAGIAGQGAFFPGRANPAYIAVTNWNGIEILTNGAVSIWAQFTTNSYDGSTLVDAGDLGHPNSWRLGRDQSANVRFLVFDGNGTPQVKVNFPDDSMYNGQTATYATAKWHQYAVTWDGLNITGYYDGLPISTNSLGVPFLRITAGGHWMAIGCRQRDGTPQWGDDAYPSTGWMGGSIDELRMYSRALSGQFVGAIYRNNSRLAPPVGLRVVTSP
jgi:hypothetical protein